MSHGPRHRPAAARNHRSRACFPNSVEVVLGNQVYIDRSKLPPALVNRIARLAAFQNPEFYAAQAMRLPTFGKPRVISCAELFSKHIALPRGCLDDLLGLLGRRGIATELRDERQQGRPIEHTVSRRVDAGTEWRPPQLFSSMKLACLQQPRHSARPSLRRK